MCSGFLYAGGKGTVYKRTRPSPLEICTTEDESVIVCGVIYRQEQKENGQMIYLKHNSVYSISNKQKFQESKIIVYIQFQRKTTYRKQVKVRGQYHFMKMQETRVILIRSFIIRNRGSMGKSTAVRCRSPIKVWTFSGKAGSVPCRVEGTAGAGNG